MPCASPQPLPTAREPRGAVSVQGGLSRGQTKVHGALVFGLQYLRGPIWGMFLESPDDSKVVATYGHPLGMLCVYMCIYIYIYHVLYIHVYMYMYV